MKLHTFLKLSVLLLGLISIEACLVFSKSEGSPTANLVTATPSGTSIPQVTQIPTESPSQTALPDEVRSSLLQTHEVVVMIQFDAEATAGTARQIIAGNIPQSEVPQSVLAISGLADGTEWILPFIIPPVRLQSEWEEALAIHAHTRELLGMWANGTINASQVLNEIQDDLVSISQTVEEVEGILVGEYGFEMQSLIQAREDALAGMRGSLEVTATP